MATVPAVHAELLAYGRALPSRTMVLDCRDLEFIDSSGLHMLVDLEQRCDKRIELVNVRPPVRRVFELTGLTHVFGI